MVELITQRAVAPVDWTGVPERYIGKASAVCRTLKDCEELVKFFGMADFCPYLPVLVNGPGGWTAITGMGYASAAELQDCAIALWTRQAKPIDWDARRERAGAVERSKVAAEMAEALTRRIARHRANPVTDPFRQPAYPRMNDRTVHTMPKGDSLEEYKKRKAEGFTKPKVETKPGPVVEAAKESK